METTALSIPVGAWCFRALGPGTLTPLQADAGCEMSTQFRYDSNERGIVAVKVRADSIDRIDRYLQLQRIAADAGFPCARPVTGTYSLGPGLVVSAETWRPGGTMHADGGRPFAARSAELLADLTGIL